ncbi:MAG: putative quinol monooxygenase [Candidatus Acidiferrum sp.]
MPLHTFVRFEPRAGKQRELRDELLMVLGPTRAEPGCVNIHLYEGTREPLVYFIHSEWSDNAALDAHAKLPHMTRFLGRLDDLLAHPLQAVRTKQIA